MPYPPTPEKYPIILDRFGNRLRPGMQVVTCSNAADWLFRGHRVWRVGLMPSGCALQLLPVQPEELSLREPSEPSDPFTRVLPLYCDQLEASQVYSVPAPSWQLSSYPAYWQRFLQAGWQVWLEQLPDPRIFRLYGWHAERAWQFYCEADEQELMLMSLASKGRYHDTDPASKGRAAFIEHFLTYALRYAEGGPPQTSNQRLSA